MASSDTDKEVSSSTTPELNADFDWRTLPNALDNGPWYKNEGLRKLYWITSVV